MTLMAIFLALVFLVIQVFIIILFFVHRVLKATYDRKLWQLGAFLYAQGLCIFLLLLGGYAENRAELDSDLRALTYG